MLLNKNSQCLSPHFSFKVLELKHRYNYILPPNETIYLQELKLINPSDKAWPDTTRLELAESRTDLHMENLIKIGSVPAEA